MQHHSDKELSDLLDFSAVSGQVIDFYKQHVFMKNYILCIFQTFVPPVPWDAPAAALGMPPRQNNNMDLHYAGYKPG